MRNAWAAAIPEATARSGSVLYQACERTSGRKSETTRCSGSRHKEHTHLAHSGRVPERRLSRSAIIESLFRTSPRSSRKTTAGGPEIKKQGLTRPVAPITAEYSKTLQRTGGYSASPQTAEKYW